MIKSKTIPIFDHSSFLSRITATDDGCWKFRSKIKTSNGKKTYHVLFVRGSEFLAHRLSYEIFNGRLINGMVVDHICKNVRCVNPEHLRQVESRENSIDNSDSLWAINAKKTHCKNDHELIGDNLITSIGSMGRGGITRRCRICENAKQRERHRKKRIDSRPSDFSKEVPTSFV